MRVRYEPQAILRLIREGYGAQVVEDYSEERAEGEEPYARIHAST